MTKGPGKMSHSWLTDLDQCVAGTVLNLRTSITKGSAQSDRCSSVPDLTQSLGGTPLDSDPLVFVTKDSHQRHNRCCVTDTAQGLGGHLSNPPVLVIKGPG